MLPPMMSDENHDLPEANLPYKATSLTWCAIGV
jgi:hypothetical protein